MSYAAISDFHVTRLLPSYGYYCMFKSEKVSLVTKYSLCHFFLILEKFKKTYNYWFSELWKSFFVNSKNIEFFIKSTWAELATLLGSVSPIKLSYSLCKWISSNSTLIKSSHNRKKPIAIILPVEWRHWSLW